MKYILIKGAMNSGKSATAKDICRRLNPSSIKQLCVNETDPVTLRRIDLSGLGNGTYLLRVRKKCILVVAGAPTEQRIKITTILMALHSMEIYPDLAIISMCGIEKLKDFATAKELQLFGECVHETKIYRIPSNNFSATEEWDERVSRITSLALKSI